MIGEVGAPVETTLGKMAGEKLTIREQAIYCYRGVPYATPPIGVRRWRDAEPAEPWTGVRQATQFAPHCPQPDIPATLHYLAEARRLVSEDCLYLNIWTAAEPGTTGDGQRAVMVWIHGGAMLWGGSAQPLYDGAELARKGVVVVTINYRLGVFGLFTHPELTAESPHGASGNYALGDQIAALRWVRDNIANFGGDPGNVTIFGESAGSAYVQLLTTCPEASGLFHRGVGESACYFVPMMSLADAEAADAVIAAGDSLSSLRELSASALLARTKESRFADFHPNVIVDGHLIRRSVQETYEGGMQAKVPLLLGFTANEGSAFDVPGRPQETWTRDLMARPMLQWADLAAAAQPVHLFLFNHTPAGGEVELPFADGSRRPLRAFHSSEVSYVFNNERNTPRLSPNLPVGVPSAADLDLADLMSDFWVAFARHGAPCPKGLEDAWPPYDPQGGRYYEFHRDRASSGVRTGLLDALS